MYYEHKPSEPLLPVSGLFITSTMLSLCQVKTLTCYHHGTNFHRLNVRHKVCVSINEAANRKVALCIYIIMCKLAYKSSIVFATAPPSVAVFA